MVEEEERRRKELYCILNITYLHNITTYNVCTKYSCKFSEIIYVVDSIYTRQIKTGAKGARYPTGI